MDEGVWKPLIVCGEVDNPCGFSDLVTLAENLITDMVIIATFLAVVAFIYIGFLLLTSGGSPKKKDQAKEVAWKVLKGYLWILGAWLLIYTITNALLKPGYSLLG